MSGSNGNGRLLPANINLLPPGTRAFRLSDALNAPVNTTQLQVSVTLLQSQVATLQGQITTLQGQVSTLQGQVSTLQGQVAAQQTVINSFNYLQTEVSTGTLFLDTRTIYKRSFVINNALNGALTNFVYPHLIANISYIVNIQAMAALPSQPNYPLTFVNMAAAPAFGVGLSIWADTTNIIISVGNNAFTNYQVLATLWYTATDR